MPEPPEARWLWISGLVSAIIFLAMFVVATIVGGGPSSRLVYVAYALFLAGALVIILRTDHR
jgi:hypothetical protein